MAPPDWHDANVPSSICRPTAAPSLFSGYKSHQR
jgi:hypothetical protein